MIKGVILALLVATSIALQVNLEQQTVSETLYAIKTDSKNKKSAVANDELKDGDWVYTYSPRVADKEQSAVFDVSQGSNWQFVDKETTPINGKDTVTASQGRVNLSKAQEQTLTKVEFGGEELKDVKVESSSTADASTNAELFKAATIGLALDRDTESNFFSNVEKAQKLQQRGFSFVFADKVSTLFFGAPQEFFVDTKQSKKGLETISAKGGQGKAWQVPFKTAGIQVEGGQPIQETPKIAEFDTTTRYIWVDDKLWEKLSADLQGQNCQDINQTNNVGIFECEGPEDQYPPLKFTFQTSSASDAEDSQEYVVKNYTAEGKDGKRRLLIRKGARYANDVNAAPVPAFTGSDANQTKIIFGTVFLENVYTYFNVEDNSVQLGQAFDVKPQPSAIDSQWRTWALVLGTLGMLAILAAILKTLKKVPTFGASSVLPSVPKQSYAPPATTSYVQQAPVYSYVVQPQATMSPARIQQSGYAPQYVVKQ